MLMTQLTKSFLEHGQGKLNKGKTFLWSTLVLFAFPAAQDLELAAPLPTSPCSSRWDLLCSSKPEVASADCTNQLSPRASHRTFMLSFRGELLFSSCPQSLPELCCSVSIKAVPGCRYPANTVQTWPITTDLSSCTSQLFHQAVLNMCSYWHHRPPSPLAPGTCRQLVLSSGHEKAGH